MIQLNSALCRHDNNLSPIRSPNSVRYSSFFLSIYFSALYIYNYLYNGLTHKYMHTHTLSPSLITYISPYLNDCGEGFIQVCLLF